MSKFPKTLFVAFDNEEDSYKDLITSSVLEMLRISEDGEHIAEYKLVSVKKYKRKTTTEIFEVKSKKEKSK